MYFSDKNTYRSKQKKQRFNVNKKSDEDSGMLFCIFFHAYTIDRNKETWTHTHNERMGSKEPKLTHIHNKFKTQLIPNMEPIHLL